MGLGQRNVMAGNQSGDYRTNIWKTEYSKSPYAIYSFRGIYWPKLLYQKLICSGMNVSIYNSGHCGNRAVEELLRLLRDVYALKHDYIISMSGVNDSSNFPFENKFYMEHMRAKEEQDFGKEYFRRLQLEESNFKFWLGMKKIMKVVTEAYGAIVKRER